jgi:hypothetical protein
VMPFVMPRRSVSGIPLVRMSRGDKYKVLTFEPSQFDFPVVILYHNRIGCATSNKYLLDILNMEVSL